MDVKELRRLLRLMRDFDLSELEIEEEGHRVRLRRGVEVGYAPAPQASPAPAAEPATPAAASERDIAAEGLVEIPSPMVGTFYRAPSPDEEQFAQVGDTVNPETAVCIIEAMKVMNEIEAEINGEIREILVNNAEAVEFGQPLFLVRPAGE